MGFTVFSNHQCALSIQANKENGTIQLGFYDQDAHQFDFELDHIQVAWWLAALKASPEQPVVWNHGECAITVRQSNRKYQIQIENPGQLRSRSWFSKDQGASIAQTLLNQWLSLLNP